VASPIQVTSARKRNVECDTKESVAYELQRMKKETGAILSIEKVLVLFVANSIAASKDPPLKNAR